VVLRRALQDGLSVSGRRVRLPARLRRA